MNLSWILWTSSIVFFCLGLTETLKQIRASELLPRDGRVRLQLDRVCTVLRDLEECMEAGILPDRASWDELRALEAPWGRLCTDSVEEIRRSGGAVLPTLKRIRALASAQRTALAEAKARSSQALAQAAACVLLVPVLGCVLHLLLPGVEDHPALWGAVCGAALLWAAGGAYWLIRLADSARWAGIRQARRSWMLASQCSGERFLALLRCGQPADMAWSRAIEAMRIDAPELALIWGSSLFAPEDERQKPALAGAERALGDAGTALRRAIHASVMEGRPCAERVELIFESLRTDLRAAIERELTLLGTRSLKPLFLCVAPALLGMLGAGLSLGMLSELQGGF